MIKNAPWLTNPSATAPYSTTTMCRTQWLFSISHKMLLDPVKAHQSQWTTGGLHCSDTSSKLPTDQSPSATTTGTANKIWALGQEDEYFTSTGTLTHRAFIIWKCKTNFKDYLIYIMYTKITLQKYEKMLCWPRLIPSPSHWCSYSNLGFNRYQSKLPSKKSREAPSNCPQIWQWTTLG